MPTSIIPQNHKEHDLYIAISSFFSAFVICKIKCRCKFVKAEVNCSESKPAVNCSEMF